ncbi:ATP/GTP-binding protein [Streptomyces phaeochromogenes]|uniref:ATP/GTP-binding protein n=1 Tax=Streptomyces phaeochromogenes TaxID=1923 RepID=A0ABZ1GZT0_STRPH|nr:ATP/GTP-binding protein [Streptomyces phaeochromogenes]WSD11776.1 ATP/GTP-binding protein [Streptomyces phaeochromogenes]
MLRRPALAAVLSAAALCALAALPAHSADDPVIGGDCEGASSFVTVCRQEPGNPGGQDQTGDQPGTGTGKDSKPRPQTCAVERLDPQPPASDPLWNGHKPGDGAIYTRVCLSDALGGAAGAQIVPQVFWAAEAPAVNVDPEQLARQAVDRMLLTGPDIASPRAAGKYIVGVPMWMWVNESPTTYGPNTASASLAGVTVTAKAKVTKIDWAMGDGNAVTCRGPGTAYQASYGKQESPTCGHTYSRTSASRSGGKYSVNATATWTVDWQVNGGGEAGQFTETRQSQAQVAMGELQVVR